MSTQSDRFTGILLLNKPSRVTSHDVVDRVRHIVGQRSVGHSGTLDPAAEGLMILCLGKATKVSQYLSAESKSYEAEVRLGAESTTFDAEGVDLTVAPRTIPQLDSKSLEEMLKGFRGRISQQVPAYSAVQVDGDRLYKLARRGKDVERPIREVDIYELKLTAFGPNWLRLDVTCGKGTYIRSLAHDIGCKLGCGGYLAHLRRTAVGRYSLDDALTLQELQDLCSAQQLSSRLVPIEQALDFGAMTVRDSFSATLIHGRAPRATDVVDTKGDFASGDRVLIKNQQGLVLAVGKATVAACMLGRNAAAEVFTFDRVLA
jgi:tRNA pseudouridine55 synthase